MDIMSILKYAKYVFCVLFPTIDFRFIAKRLIYQKTSGSVRIQRFFYAFPYLA